LDLITNIATAKFLNNEFSFAFTSESKIKCISYQLINEELILHYIDLNNKSSIRVELLTGQSTYDTSKNIFTVNINNPVSEENQISTTSVILGLSSSTNGRLAPGSYMVGMIRILDDFTESKTEFFKDIITIRDNTPLLNNADIRVNIFCSMKSLPTIRPSYIKLVIGYRHNSFKNVVIMLL